MDTSSDLTQMKNTILHPTDFSPASKNALEYAFELAKTLKCKLEIVHSIDFSGNLKEEENVLSLISFTNNLEYKTYRKLNELQLLGKEKGIECETSLHTGKVNTWLPKYITEREPLMVVMGKNDTAPITHKVFGSDTYTIIKNLDSPVLVVPETAKIKEFKHLILSTDNKKRDLEAIQFLMKLAGPSSAKIDIVHVLNDASSENEKNHDQLHDLKNRVEKIDNDNKFNYSLINSEDTEQKLRLLSKEKQSDILTLVMKKKSTIKNMFSRSLTANMVYKTEVPLLIFSA